MIGYIEFYILFQINKCIYMYEYKYIYIYINIYIYIIIVNSITNITVQ